MVTERPKINFKKKEKREGPEIRAMLSLKTAVADAADAAAAAAEDPLLKIPRLTPSSSDPSTGGPFRFRVFLGPPRNTGRRAHEKEMAELATVLLAI